MIDRPCPLCDNCQASSLFAEARIEHSKLDKFAYASRKLPEYMHHRLMACHECDVLYASPMPDSTELHMAYKSAAFDSQVEARYAAQTYIASINRLCSQLPDRNGALDIGAGDGAFCGELIQEGFSHVIGLEPSSAPIAAAPEHLRSCLLQEMFTPGRFQAAKFSLVTCFQTIEHVPFPAALCEEVVRILKPGGAFCIVAHNRRATSARLLGRRSPIFDLEHLQLFSPASLRRLLESAGLKSVKVRTLWNRYPISYWMRLLPVPLLAKQATIRGLNATAIGSVPFRIPAGNLIAWGFR